MVKMVTLFLFIMVMVTHMAFLLVICCPNVDHKVRLKTKPNVRKKQEVIPAEVFLFSQMQINFVVLNTLNIFVCLPYVVVLSHTARLCPLQLHAHVQLCKLVDDII